MRVLWSFLLSLYLVTPSLAAVKVVASFSILGDLVKQVGGNYVDVETIVGPNEDAHVFNPTPQHSIMLANADLVVMNGLGLEGWIDRLVEASGFKGLTVVATNGVKPLKLDMGIGPNQDPHA